MHPQDQLGLKAVAILNLGIATVSIGMPILSEPLALENQPKILQGGPWSECTRFLDWGHGQGRLAVGRAALGTAKMLAPASAKRGSRRPTSWKPEETARTFGDVF